MSTQHERLERHYKEATTEAIIALTTAMNKVGEARAMFIRRLPAGRAEELKRIQAAIQQVHADLYAFEPPLMDHLKFQCDWCEEWADLDDKRKGINSDGKEVDICCYCADSTD